MHVPPVKRDYKVGIRLDDTGVTPFAPRRRVQAIAAFYRGVRAPTATPARRDAADAIRHRQTQAVATFIHQMVPHHNNAVNMAKILLKSEV